MRVNVVRIAIATIGALAVSTAAVVVSPSVATAATTQSSPLIAPTESGLRPPGICASISPGGIPAYLTADETTLPAGYWFEECRVGARVHLRNLTPAVWSIDLARSGAQDPPPIPARIVPRYQLFHSQYPTAPSQPTIAPGETLAFSDVDQFVITQDPAATAAWIASRSTTKWLKDVADINLRKEVILAAAARRGTAGRALADCYSAAEAQLDSNRYANSEDALAANIAVVYSGMKSTSCLNALKRFRANPTITATVEQQGDALLGSVSRSIGETASVSALERYASLLRQLLRR